MSDTKNPNEENLNSQSIHNDLYTGYENIKGFSDNLHAILKELKHNNLPLPFGLTEFPLVIEMDLKKGIDGLGKFVDKFDRIAAVLGIEEHTDPDGLPIKKLTISFVPLREGSTLKKRIISNKGGQETWPPPDTFNFSQSTDVPPLP